MYSERQMQMDPYKLTIQREIDRWDEGIPLGNGELGALVFGSAKKLTVSLDRGDIWDKSGSPENTPGFCYANLVKWAKSGNRKAIYKTFDLPYQRPTPTKLPCGRLELFVQGDRVPQDCCFALDLKTAVCTFTNGDFRLAAFVHVAQGVGMLKTEGAPVKIRLVRPKFGKRTKYSAFFERFSRRAAVSNKLKNVKYPEPVLKQQLVRDVRVQLFIQPLNDGSAFGVAVGERQTAWGQEFAFYAYSGRGEALENILTEKVTDALRKGYDALFPSHRAWWRAYNARSEICVPDDYIQSRYNMGNYLLGSASRKGNFPMPLQGLWTACDDKYLPPWKGDYHHDLNTELTYLSFLKANRLEQGECFLDYLASLTERGRDFARNFYDADGICLPAVMDIDGYALGGWPMYSLSPTNQLWLCQSFERCYAYTGDIEFLRKTAYPFIEQSARCILSLLQEDTEGFYVLPISSSPEIHDNTQKSFLTPNSNYDQALLLYTFSCLARLADVLGKADDRRLWEATLQKLCPLAVNAAHVLRLSRDEDLRESHRHQSHAMAIPTVILAIGFTYMPYDSMTMLWKCVTVLLYNIGFQFFYMFMFDSYTNIINVLSPNTYERSDVNSVTAVVDSFAPTIAGFLLPLLAQLIAGQNTIYDMRIYRAVFPPLLLFGLLLTVFIHVNTEEKIVQAKTHVVQIKFWDALRAVAKNKYFWIISLAGWIGFLESSFATILAWLYNRRW